MWKTVTKWVIIATMVVLIGYDILAISTPENGDSISEILRDWGSRLWVLPYYMSILIGHWFINYPRTNKDILMKYLILGASGALTLFFNLLIDIHMPWFVTIPAGLLTGAMFWPQREK